MNIKILFTYLTAFNSFGGLEKFNKAFIKAIGESKIGKTTFYSLHDQKYQDKYLGRNCSSWFTAKGNKMKFVLGCLRSSISHDIIILGHLNLSVFAILVKKFFPNKKIILICHGIEIWQENSWIQLRTYPLLDHLITVSNYTKSQLIEKRGVDPSKISVFQNTIDPYFNIPEDLEKPSYLNRRYKIKGKKCILTVCRISSNEGYKGYDRVLRILPNLVKHDKNIRYLLVGKYDLEEKRRLDKIIHKFGIEEFVIFTSFVPDAELVDHFKLGDIFIMPSNNEGFGIVFIEAMACGVPVIAGNKDGSRDAVVQGELGVLIDPENENEIFLSLQEALNKPLTLQERKKIQQRVLNHFSYKCFVTKLDQILQKCAE